MSISNSKAKAGNSGEPHRSPTSIILELQSSGTRRAEDLAGIFETSKRTIYRDVQALCEAGVPVVAIPGQGYSLAEGYFLPPIQFTADEATMLLLGEDVMRQSFDAESGTAAIDAARKITDVLPEKLRDHVNAVKESILFFSPAGTAAEIECLQKLRQAILKQQTIIFNYRGRHDEVSKPSEVNPYGLANVEGVWYLRGYCHRRQAERNFRLSLIQDLLLLDQTFICPPQAQRPVCYEQTDSEQALSRVEPNGGKVLMPKTAIGDPGFIGIIIDTEGNQIGLHAPHNGN